MNSLTNESLYNIQHINRDTEVSLLVSVYIYVRWRRRRHVQEHFTFTVTLIITIPLLTLLMNGSPLFFLPYYDEAERREKKTLRTSLLGVGNGRPCSLGNNN